MLSAFRRSHPGVELNVTEYEPPAGIEAVADGRADLALTHVYERGPDPDPPAGVVAVPLGSRPLAPPGLRRTIALAHRGGTGGSAVRALRALLLGTYRRA